MGELILCDKPIAANPIYIEEASLNIYSLEELSYYIANNPYLLNADFISVDLCNWIGRELECKDLEHQLLEMIGSNVPLHIFVGQILSYCGYLTDQEIKSVTAMIASFENKSEIECQKMRADRLMEKDKIMDAIYEYEHMIDDGSLNLAPSQVEGDVWHNLGCAYARLFFFREACGCFEEAYKRNRKMQSLRSMLACMRCAKDEETFIKLVDEYHVPHDVVDSVKDEVSNLSKQEEIASFDHWVNEWYENSDYARTYASQVEQVMLKWQDEYKRLCQI